MLKQETIDGIANALGLDAQDFAAKIKSEEEQEIKLKEGNFFTMDDLEKRDSSKYNEGKTAGSEIPVKNLKKKYEYDFEGKDIEDFLNVHDSKLKEKYTKDESERVKELESDLEKQRGAFQTEIEGLKTTNSTLETNFRSQQRNNRLLSLMPKETTIKKEAILTLFNSDYEVSNEDGKEFIVHNGQKLKDEKTQEPLGLDYVFNDFITNEGYSKKAPGRGGGNEHGDKGYSKKMTPGEFEEQWKHKNPGESTTSPVYVKDYAEFRKEQKAK